MATKLACNIAVNKLYPTVHGVHHDPKESMKQFIWPIVIYNKDIEKRRAVFSSQIKLFDNRLNVLSFCFAFF